mgnify:CR=1 FL=1|tara:strand:+ start:2593 stop:3192 length:600 start_codon:yes stop_codon:yes gene_type:complete
MASDFKYSSQRYNRDGYNRIVDLTGTAVLKYRKSGTSQITLKVDGTLDVEKITVREITNRNHIHIISGGYDGGSSTSLVYLPLTGSITESSALTNNNELTGFLAPYGGKLKKVVLRFSDRAPGSTVVGFHKASDASENPSATATESVTVTPTGLDYDATFTFTNNNSFSKGDLIAISVNPTNAAEDVNFSVVLSLNLST